MPLYIIDFLFWLHKEGFIAAWHLKHINPRYFPFDNPICLKITGVFLIGGFTEIVIRSFVSLILSCLWSSFHKASDWNSFAVKPVFILLLLSLLNTSPTSTTNDLLVKVLCLALFTSTSINFTSVWPWGWSLAIEEHTPHLSLRSWEGQCLLWEENEIPITI